MTKNRSPVVIRKQTPGYWRVTLDNPPLNLFDPEISSGLEGLINELETDEEVKVVVFDSAVEDYFMAHIDLIRVGELELDPGPTGVAPWPDVALRLERGPFVTIGLVRGRARGVGDEFLLAMDMRFASLEKAIFGQIEVGCGVIPGGGGLERLPRLIGRARAMELIIGGEDIDARTAERYGLVNRAIPDAELDAFVDHLARRIASFDRPIIAMAKRLLNARTFHPSVEELKETQVQFFEALAFPATKARLSSLLERGLQTAGDVELRLGYHLAPEK